MNAIIIMKIIFFKVPKGAKKKKALVMQIIQNECTLYLLNK